MFTLSFPFYIPTVVQVCHLELVYTQYFIVLFYNSKFAIYFFKRKKVKLNDTPHTWSTWVWHPIHPITQLLRCFLQQAASQVSGAGLCFRVSWLALRGGTGCNSRIQRFSLQPTQPLRQIHIYLGRRPICASMMKRKKKQSLLPKRHPNLCNPWRSIARSRKTKRSRWGGVTASNKEPCCCCAWHHSSRQVGK